MDQYARPKEEKVDHYSRLKKENLEGFRTKESMPNRQIGIESEFALVSNDPDPNKFGKSILLTNMEQLFERILKNNPDWNRYSGSDMTLLKRVKEADMTIGTDLGQGTLEVGITPKTSLKEAREEFKSLMESITHAAEESNIWVLGYGVQPISKGTKEIAMPKPRYDRLEQYFGNDLFWHTINAASQVHVDATKDEMIKGLNTLNAYSPAMIALTGNSRVSGGVDTTLSDIRNTFWEKLVEKKPEDHSRVGIAPIFKSYDDYFETLVSFKPLLTKRDDDFLVFEREESLKRYMERGKATAYVMSDNGRNGMRVEITPDLIDVKALQSNVYTDARIQSTFGTIEFRPCSQQPSVDATVAIAATILGLMSNLDKAHERIESYPIATLKTARKNATKFGMHAVMGSEPMNRFVKEMLDIAKEGLENIKEDTKFLDVFYDRVERGRNPANQSVHVLRTEGLESFVEHLKLRV